MKAVLAIDQGTTNSKAVLIAPDGTIVAHGSAPLGISHPRPGWVEQDGAELWRSQLAAIRACLAHAPGATPVAIGISNQRESVLAWERDTGTPIGPLISWQCRRTADACARLAAEGLGPEVLARTGLPLDPMFPATKLAWLLEHCRNGRRVDAVALGTVDAWLIRQLTGGEVHATDASNASRTQLFDLARQRWDPELAALFGIPPSCLPEVRDSSGTFGTTRGVTGLPDGIPVAAAISDSHAALFGHGAFDPGDGKITFGTGSSVMATVPSFRPPPHGITTTVAWSLDGVPTFALEGNILVSASILPWTARLLGLADVDALMALAATVPDSGGVSLVPAHVGLGAPHWDTAARGLISGLSFGSGPAQVARAAAESIALQVRDVVRAMHGSAPASTLFVDGGPSRNPFLMQLVADCLQRPLQVTDAAEASALGAGHLAGLAAGVWADRATLANLERPSRALDPNPADTALHDLFERWHAGIERTLLTTEDPAPS